MFSKNRDRLLENDVVEFFFAEAMQFKLTMTASNLTRMARMMFAVQQEARQ